MHQAIEKTLNSCYIASVWLKWKYYLVNRFWYYALPIWRNRGFWIRVLLCWSVGLMALTFDEFKSFDTRLVLRGQNEANPDIVILNITQEDRNKFFNPSFLDVDVVSDSRNHLPDNLYWNKTTWLKILEKLLEDEPKGIGVTFFFGDNISPISLSQEEKEVFYDSSIIWITYIDSLEQVKVPQFSNTYRDNIGIGNIQPELDGITRSFSSPLIGTPHVAARLSEKVAPRPSAEYVFPTKRLINFRGGLDSFPHVTMSEVLLNKLPKNYFKDKLVIIGSDASPMYQFLTPLGPMSRAKLIAHITDNILSKRWIHYLDKAWYILYLSLILFLTIFIMQRYTNQATIIFTLSTIVGYLALSILFFDSYFVWLPIMAPTIQVAFTWITFVGYRASAMEKKNWRLRQEQLYSRQVEELKGNFVSLISHDLKTPIAKIQGVVDRLMTQHPDHPFFEDLKAVRSYSEELHRYIRSILQITKVESKDFQLNLQIAEINEIIEETITRLSPLAVSKQIRLEKQLEPMFSIELDETLIQEVIANLVENAIKYTPDGGSVTIFSKEVKERIYVTVVDTGQGIGDDEQKSIWKKFVRGKEQDLITKGTGIGLYLVKYFVELHGGEVFLESTLNKGTKIGFWLPIEIDISIKKPDDLQEIQDMMMNWLK